MGGGEKAIIAVGGRGRREGETPSPVLGAQSWLGRECWEGPVG